MAVIFQSMNTNAFSLKEMFRILIQILMKCVPKGLLDNVVAPNSWQAITLTSDNVMWSH